MSVAVDIRELSVSLDRAPVVRDFSLQVAPGEWVTLIGPNGAGKTTILRAVAGLVSFTGSVSIHGYDVSTGTPRNRAQRVAIVPQKPHTPAELTVSEYVLLGRTPHISYFSTEQASDRLASERALSRLSLRPFADRSLGSLSGGELQRTVLARALAQEAPVLLLDEPTSALDLGHQQHALELVDALRRQEGLTIISAMHDLSLAGQFADRLVLIDRGTIAAEGDARAVLSEANIAAHYGAVVRIHHGEGLVYVLPARSHTR